METEFPSLGWAAIDWIEHYLVHGPGDVQGEPIELDDEFAAFIVKAYRVDAKSGDKVVRRGFLSRSKGRAKSELAGMLDCFEALGPCRFDHWASVGEVSSWGYAYEPGEAVGRLLTYVEILNVATEEGQAGNTYDNAYFMLHPDTCSPELLADFGKLDVGLTRISLPNRRGFIEPVTAANESKDGGKSTFIVADETHLWLPPATGRFKLGLMHQTMARNLLKRKVASGWMLETSTMYAEGEGSVAEGTHAYAKSPAGRSGKLLFDHRQAGDGYDLSKRRDRISALREAYGPAAAWMPLAEIADSYEDPQVDPAEWERFWSNRPVPLKRPKASELLGWSDLRIGGVDVPRVGALGIAVALGQTSSGLVAAGRWDDGRIHLSPSYDESGVLDYQPGTAWVVARVKEIQDRHGCHVFLDEKCPDSELAGRLLAAGVAFTSLNTERMCEACSGVHNAVAASWITHFGEPVMQQHVDAVTKRDVGDGRWMWGRRKSSGEIALLEAATCAHWGIHNHQPKPARRPVASFV